MDISKILVFVTLMVVCQPDQYGASSCGKEWVDPDPLSKINPDRASGPLMKESRFVIQNDVSSCFMLLHKFLTLQ
jgi:hypothetical protein